MSAESEKGRDPELRVVKALYPNYSGGDTNGILVDNDFYHQLWVKHNDRMRNHFIRGMAAGNNTFVSGLGLKAFMDEFGLWVEDEDAKPVDMTGLKGV